MTRVYKSNPASLSVIMARVTKLRSIYTKLKEAKRLKAKEKKPKDTKSEQGKEAAAKWVRPSQAEWDSGVASGVVEFLDISLFD